MIDSQGKVNADNQNEVSCTIKNEIVLGMLNVLFEQVRLQQEVRDRWFGHFLSIEGAIVAFATLLIKLFEDTLSLKYVSYLGGGIFVFSTIIGYLFYFLYLNQRMNYVRTYYMLSELQNELSKSIPSITVMASTAFKSRKHGADYFTLLIQNLICSTCAGISSAFFTLVYTRKYLTIGSNFVLAFVFSAIILYVIHKRYWRVK